MGPSGVDDLLLEIRAGIDRECANHTLQNVQNESCSLRRFDRILGILLAIRWMNPASDLPASFFSGASLTDLGAA